MITISVAVTVWLACLLAVIWLGPWKQCEMDYALKQLRGSALFLGIIIWIIIISKAIQLHNL